MALSQRISKERQNITTGSALLEIISKAEKLYCSRPMVIIMQQLAIPKEGIPQTNVHQ